MNSCYTFTRLCEVPKSCEDNFTAFYRVAKLTVLYTLKHCSIAKAMVLYSTRNTQNHFNM